MTGISVISLAIVGGLTIYLTIALLWPEWFE